ncbi:MAG: hypothetical protein WCJ30_17065 [Deltaproteobacteria bacterium]
MPIFSMRVLPSRPGQGHLVHAHLEAHDHLAVATDFPDGSLEIAGPSDLAEDIRAVTLEIAHAVGALVIEPRATSSR